VGRDFGKREEREQDMRRRGIIFVLLFWVSGCGGSEVTREDSQGEVCGRVKVPLVLASKLLEDGRGGNIHVWRVSLDCRTHVRVEGRDEGLEREVREVEFLDVSLTLKGFVAEEGLPHRMEIPYVVMVKDDIGGVVLGKKSGRVWIEVLRNEVSGEISVRERVKWDLEEKPAGRDGLYPTVYVGLELSRKEWHRFKEVVEETGERALLPGVGN
jgi:hypothetical protein